MKKSNLLKLIVVVGLSIVLAFSIASVVRADDNTDYSGWTDLDPVSTNSANNTSTDNNSAIDNNTTANSLDTTNSYTTTNEYNSTISTENATTTLNTSTTNENNEVNNLAYTGIEDNSLLIVVILVGAIVAGYSLKKVKEYNI